MSAAIQAEELPYEAAPNEPTSRPLDALIADVYADLMRLGRALLRGENQESILDAGAIIHEAYLRLTEAGLQVHDRAHCFRLIAAAMRRVVIDSARARRRSKRELPPPDELRLLCETEHTSDPVLNALDTHQAMMKLAAADAGAAHVILLHGYYGFAVPELAVVFRVSEATITRKICTGKEFLARCLEHRLLFLASQAQEG